MYRKMNSYSIFLMRKVQFILQIYCILVYPQNDAAKIVSVSAMLVYIHQKNKLVHYN